MDARDVDVLVVGTGASGLTVAHKCREAQWTVAIVDKQPFGGTCALRGCDPKKVLVGVAEAADAAGRFFGHGLEGEVRVKWEDLMRFKRSFTEPVPDERDASLQEAGIETFHDVARFVSPEVVEIGEERLRPRHVVIAAGAKPRTLDIPGEEHVTTSAQFLGLDHLPEKIAFIGGGYISMEFAHLAQRAGAQVSILHRSDRVLKHFDATVVHHLENATRRAGIDLRLQTRISAVEETARGLRVRGHGPDGPITMEADLVVHGAGRVPDVDELALDKAGIERGRRGGVKVDKHLRSTSRPNVWACGDAAESEGAPLTPIASLEGSVVAHNLLHEKKRSADYRGTPSVAFCHPRIASVGLTEDEARAAGKRFRVSSAETTSWFSSRRLREKDSAYKVIIDEETDQVLGAHLLGPHADEVINVFAMAIRHSIPAKDLRHGIYSYPTNSSDIPYML